MSNYIPLLKEALDRRRIGYSHHGKVLMFARNYRHRSEPAVEVPLKFVFLLFDAQIEVIVSIPVALTPEQAAGALPLLAETNKELTHGEVDTDNASNCLCFSDTFDALAGGEWCAEAREEMQACIVEYATELVPCILLDVFVRVAGLAAVPHDVAADNG